MGNYVSETFNSVGDTPDVATIQSMIVRSGPAFRIDIVLDEVEITITDGSGSGSHGSVKLFDFVEGAFHILSSRIEIDALAENATLTTAAGDAVLAFGLGTVAISAAANGVVSSTAVNIGASLAATMASGGLAAPVQAVTAANLAVNGTATPGAVYLSVSGTADTIDATGILKVSGTVSIAGIALSDH